MSSGGQVAAAFLSPVVRRRDTPDLVIGFLASIVAGVIVVELSTNLRKVHSLTTGFHRRSLRRADQPDLPRAARRAHRHRHRGHALRLHPAVHHAQVGHCSTGLQHAALHPVANGLRCRKYSDFCPEISKTLWDLDNNWL